MVNKVFLVGRLGKDPVIQHFQDGGAIASFSIATSENYKDKEGNWKEITDWHNIKISNKFMAERAEKYLKKGSLIHIEGKIRTRSYDKDGSKHYITEVVVDQYRMLDKKSDAGSTEGANTGYQQQASSSSVSEESPSQATAPAVDDDLPF